MSIPSVAIVAVKASKSGIGGRYDIGERMWCVLGSDKECDVQIKHPHVPPLHCLINIEDGKIFMQALSETYPVLFHDGAIFNKFNSRRRLKHNQAFYVGPRMFIVDTSGGSNVRIPGRDGPEVVATRVAGDHTTNIHGRPVRRRTSLLLTANEERVVDAAETQNVISNNIRTTPSKEVVTKIQEKTNSEPALTKSVNQNINHARLDLLNADEVDGRLSEDVNTTASGANLQPGIPASSDNVVLPEEVQNQLKSVIPVSKENRNQDPEFSLMRQVMNTGSISGARAKAKKMVTGIAKNLQAEKARARDDGVPVEQIPTVSEQIFGACEDLHGKNAIPEANETPAPKLDEEMDAKLKVRRSPRLLRPIAQIADSKASSQFKNIEPPSLPPAESSIVSKESTASKAKVKPTAISAHPVDEAVQEEKPSTHTTNPVFSNVRKTPSKAMTPAQRRQKAFERLSRGLPSNPIRTGGTQNEESSSVKNTHVANPIAKSIGGPQLGNLHASVGSSSKPERDHERQEQSETHRSSYSTTTPQPKGDAGGGKSNGPSDTHRIKDLKIPVQDKSSKGKITIGSNPIAKKTTGRKFRNPYASIRGNTDENGIEETIGNGETIGNEGTNAKLYSRQRLHPNTAPRLRGLLSNRKSRGPRHQRGKSVNFESPLELAQGPHYSPARPGLIQGNAILHNIDYSEEKSANEKGNQVQRQLFNEEAQEISHPTSPSKAVDGKDGEREALNEAKHDSPPQNQLEHNEVASSIASSDSKDSQEEGSSDEEVALSNEIQANDQSTGSNSTLNEDKDDEEERQAQVQPNIPGERISPSVPNDSERVVPQGQAPRSPFSTLLGFLRRLSNGTASLPLNSDGEDLSIELSSSEPSESEDFTESNTFSASDEISGTSMENESLDNQSLQEPPPMTCSKTDGGNQALSSSPSDASGDLSTVLGTKEATDNSASEENKIWVTPETQLPQGGKQGPECNIVSSAQEPETAALAQSSGGEKKCAEDHDTGDCADISADVAPALDVQTEETDNDSVCAPGHSQEQVKPMGLGFESGQRMNDGPRNSRGLILDSIYRAGKRVSDGFSLGTLSAPREVEKNEGEDVTFDPEAAETASECSADLCINERLEGGMQDQENCDPATNLNCPSNLSQTILETTHDVVKAAVNVHSVDIENLELDHPCNAQNALDLENENATSSVGDAWIAKLAQEIAPKRVSNHALTTSGSRNQSTGGPGSPSVNLVNTENTPISPYDDNGNNEEEEGAGNPYDPEGPENDVPSSNNVFSSDIPEIVQKELPSDTEVNKTIVPTASTAADSYDEADTKSRCAEELRAEYRKKKIGSLKKLLKQRMPTATPRALRKEQVIDLLVASDITQQKIEASNQNVVSNACAMQHGSTETQALFKYNLEHIPIDCTTSLALEEAGKDQDFVARMKKTKKKPGDQNSSSDDNEVSEKGEMNLPKDELCVGEKEKTVCGVQHLDTPEAEAGKEGKDSLQAGSKITEIQQMDDLVVVEKENVRPEEESEKTKDVDYNPGIREQIPSLTPSRRSTRLRKKSMAKPIEATNLADVSVRVTRARSKQSTKEQDDDSRSIPGSTRKQSKFASDAQKPVTRSRKKQDKASSSLANTSGVSTGTEETSTKSTEITLQAAKRLTRSKSTVGEASAVVKVDDEAVIETKAQTGTTTKPRPRKAAPSKTKAAARTRSATAANSVQVNVDEETEVDKKATRSKKSAVNTTESVATAPRRSARGKGKKNEGELGGEASATGVRTRGQRSKAASTVKRGEEASRPKRNLRSRKTAGKGNCAEAGAKRSDKNTEIEVIVIDDSSEEEARNPDAMQSEAEVVDVDADVESGAETEGDIVGEEDDASRKRKTKPYRKSNERARRRIAGRHVGHAFK